ncbi:hypothetical protein [Bradyrhizobium sp. SZCCHNRI1002]|uniref:hypothetical protein n=1 Tax=Bradyrhizobium sp. SZCCHNRI1002 TaxID=3057274 RepID=UPI0028E574B5|nr:hypothetical protein [Bradyrhizobium sp. SZCCHNRI1002]
MMLRNQFTPSDWYWAAADGRIYSSARNSLVSSNDPGYLAFVATRGSATPWPADTNGKQTMASLQDLLSHYGRTALP